MISLILCLLYLENVLSEAYDYKSMDANSSTFEVIDNEDEKGKFPDYVVLENLRTKKNPAATCSLDNDTYFININVHLQRYALESIVSGSKKSLNMEVDEREAVLGYFGTLANIINSELIDHGAQVIFNIDKYKAEDFITMDSFDKSCEFADSVSDQTSKALSELQDTYKDKIGFRLFVWTCPREQSSKSNRSILENFRCGRVVGVLWEGFSATKDNIKAAIIESLGEVGEDSIYNDGYSDMIPICRYTGGCLSHQPSVIGWKHHGIVQIEHAIRADSVVHD